MSPLSSVRPVYLSREAVLNAFVATVPLRNTSLGHLRDAFTRALLARLKVPRVAEALNDEQNEVRRALYRRFNSY